MPNFIPNRDFPKEIAETDDYLAGLAENAESIRENADQMARSIGAPWMPRDGHQVIEVVQENGQVYVVNTDYGGHLQEWGSKNNPPHAILRRAAMAAGAEVEEL